MLRCIPAPDHGTSRYEDCAIYSSTLVVPPLPSLRKLALLKTFSPFVFSPTDKGKPSKFMFWQRCFFAASFERGDGEIIHCCHMFRTSPPPVLPHTYRALSRKLGFGLLLVWGRLLLPIILRQPLLVVTGRPIVVPKVFRYL